MHSPRFPLAVACLAMVIAAALAGGAGYLHALRATPEAVGLLCLSLTVVVLGALAVPPARGGEGDE